MNVGGLFKGLVHLVAKYPKGTSLTGVSHQQVRTKYADWKMIRDVKRRKMVKEYAMERLRVNSLRKNDILPSALRAIADEEIAAFPRDSCKSRIVDRCAITSKPRATVRPWRLSRIAWRNLADYNKLSGVQRAMW
ncbi:hypothetical protein R5R35_001337 [Gryllus longicercus]|uniref:28S ribosomal protein S14, mitochondrial n=1 Tax=Gryllus longicercus TaxID=2509291 RepID=A0AAN9VJC8_9ORTH|nr:uncharacterized protein GBIM_20146 [Gryllus bimaculatus]